MAATGRAARLLTRAYSTATRVSLPDLLLRQAVPLVAASGFSANTLSRASLSLPAPHTPSTPYSRHTIDNLFPSAPPSNTFKPSLTREQLVADAQGTAGEHERIGPAKALVEAWLEEGRRVMVEHVEGNQRWRGEAGVREGVKERIRYNETVLPDLSAALALLGASTGSPLSSLSALIPIPSPAGYLEHIAKIAQDLAKASGDESQGASWYRTRARIATIYGMAELHLLSPQLATLPPAERLTSTLALVDTLLAGSNGVASKINDAQQFGTFVVRSWMGIGRSLGL